MKGVCYIYLMDEPKEAKEVIKRIDMNVTVNNDGMTLQDLLVAFLQSCDKHGLYVCGVIVKKEDSRIAEIYGMQHDVEAIKNKDFLSVQILKQTLARLETAQVLGTTAISSQTN